VLDVRRLRVLLAVGEHGSITAAARALSFTPPAVSQQVAALERQLGVALVDRTRRTVRLTEAGHRLAGHAQQVLARLEAAEADLARLDHTVSGVLNVATIPTLGSALLPQALAHLNAVAPGLDPRIEQLEPEDSLPALARGELDVALAGEYNLVRRRPHANIEREDLFTEPMLIAVPARHPQAGPGIDLADLHDARWIAPARNSSCAVMLERSCALAGYEPHVVAHCADFALAATLVSADHGVALIPTIAAPDPHDNPGLRLLTVTDTPIHRTLFAAFRHGTREHPAVSHLVTALKTSVGQHQSQKSPAPLE
jgi:DNA-binding transcriptional LysR family regulator